MLKVKTIKEWRTRRADRREDKKGGSNYGTGVGTGEKKVWKGLRKKIMVI